MRKLPGELFVEKKSYGIEQVAHFFLSDSDRGKNEAATASEHGTKKTDSAAGHGKDDLLRIASPVDEARVEREALVGAAGDFLIHYLGNPEIRPIDNITSPDFGTADLTFATPSKDRIIVVRLNEKDETGGFALTAFAYYLWLRELVAACGSILEAEICVELFCFSPHFSKSLRNAMAIHKVLGQSVHLIRYRFFQVENSLEPVIHFQSVLSSQTQRGGRQAGMVPAQTAEPSRTCRGSEKRQDVQTLPDTAEAEDHSEFMRLRRHLED